MQLDPTLALLLELRGDFAGKYAPRCLRIRTKEGAFINLRLNKAQQYVHEKLEEQRAKTGKVRALILKGRQQGISTYVEARFYFQTSGTFGLRAFILTHEQLATDKIFEIVERYHDNAPDVVRPHTGTSNAKELKFDRLDSGYEVATAGKKDVGRSGTMQRFHGSEVAFWPNADTHMTGVGQAVPNLPGTEIILESTANGIGNLFHQMWQKAERGDSEYIAIFVPWFWQDEYRLPVPEGFELTTEEEEYQQTHGLAIEQMVWRRAKIRDDFNGEVWRFKQEYPACVTGETRVGTDLGLIPIAEVHAATLATKGRIVKSHPQPPSQVYRLRTALGYELRGTWDHPIFTAGGVLVPLKACSGQRIQLCQPRLADHAYVLHWRDGPVKCQMEITPEWGLFLGLFMGDGAMCNDTLSIACTGRDHDVVETVCRLIYDLFGVESRTRITGSRRGGVEIRAHSKAIKRLLDRLGLLRRDTGKVMRRVHVPEVIFRSPASVVREFLRGLFEADGFNGYTSSKVVLFSKYPEFLADVQRLLLAFGVTARRSSRPARTGNYQYTAHELVLRAEEARRFNATIGFLSSRKRGQQPAANGRPAGDVELVDRVISVEPDGFETTYDLTVEDGAAFDANGILTHNTPDEAFQSPTKDPFITPELVTRARKRTVADPVGPLLIGVDPAWYGPDRSSIIRRRGRKAWGLQRFKRKNTMEMAGIIANIIRTENPDYVFVDVVGIGAGIVDRLHELGFDDVVIPVHAGEKATQEDRYVRKRDEIWGAMKEWLETNLVEIPDDMVLQADLCGPQYSYDSSYRLKIEKKEDMAKRGLVSPDDADALGVTFAVAVNEIAKKARGAVPERGQPYNWRA